MKVLVIYKLLPRHLEHLRFFERKTCNLTEELGRLDSDISATLIGWSPEQQCSWPTPKTGPDINTVTYTQICK
jgi:hypothetical protein